MNFFEQQDKTRNKSKTLVFLFLLAVIGIIFAIYFPIQFLWYDYFLQHKFGQDFAKDSPIIWSYSLFWKVSLGSLAVIVIGSYMKVRELAEGGCTVAHMMGGKLVEPETADFKEKQLMNVVEEMAIAAGIPVPNVYVLNQENTINAFAAGFTTGDAVIGVTRGTIENLKREELQGVIAHEFSHIMNGDMRMNIKLIGLLHGILAIGIIGRFLMQGSNRGSSRKGSGGIIFLGLALFIIGWVGYFFGKLIQAAVSRQREFLADATAVQYTRNLDGITGALKKIAGYLKIPIAGSYLTNSNSGQISHMTFGDVNFNQSLEWVATHPPIDERIKALDPQFRPEQYEKVEQKYASPAQASAEAGSFFEPPRKMQIDNTEFLVSPKIHYSSQNVSSMIGKIPSQAIEAQSAWLSEMDQKVYKACHHPQQARALLYILLTEFNEKMKTEFEKLLNLRDPHILDSFRTLWEPVKKIGIEGRLRLVDLCFPALRALPEDDYKIFTQTLVELIKLDGKMSLFEFLLMKTIQRHMRHYFKPKKTTKVSINKINSVQDEIIFLLSAIAQSEANCPTARQAFLSGVAPLFPAAEMTAFSTDDLHTLDQTLKKLLETSFDVRKDVMAACAKVALYDKNVSWSEKEMLRLIGDSLDCPIPHLE